MGATCCPSLCYDPAYGQFGQGAYGQQYGAYGQPCAGGVCQPGYGAGYGAGGAYPGGVAGYPQQGLTRPF